MRPTIAIIGTGKVGTSLGRAFIAADYPVVFGSRDPSAHTDALKGVGAERVTSVREAADLGDIVVLAVPWTAVPSALTAADEGVAGKILIDATNPITWEPDGSRHIAHPSGGEMVQELVPAARVVKAFNTLGYEQMSDPVFGDHVVDLLIAGDDEDAKRAVEEIAVNLGMRPLDAGPLRSAAIIEHVAMLWLALATSGNMGRDITIKVIER